MTTNILDQWHYFSTPVYTIKKPEFLTNVLKASNDSLNKMSKQIAMDEIYPVVQADISTYSECEEFFNYCVNTAWNLLDSQGYDMENRETWFTEIWAQDHRKYSAMEYHTHSNSQLIGFYFLECPSDKIKAVFHDPRPGKLMADLPEKNYSELSLATSTINFNVEPGQLIFTNAYVPHSFTRNNTNKPFKFIHMNISVRNASPQIIYPDTAEIV